MEAILALGLVLAYGLPTLLLVALIRSAWFGGNGPGAA